MADENIMMCCYCGQSITFDVSIEITIANDRESDEVQTVYSHSNCLDKALHETVPRGFKRSNQ